jgi:hypothetical protein
VPDGEPEGAGALAARTLEQAVALIADAARSAAPGWEGSAGAAAQAQALGRRAVQLRDENTAAFRAAAQALAGTIPSDRAATRDHLLGDALARAADVPLAIAEAAADAAGGRPVLWLPTFADAQPALEGLLRDGDLCLVLGAGNVVELGRRLVTAAAT